MAFEATHAFVIEAIASCDEHDVMKAGAPHWGACRRRQDARRQASLFSCVVLTGWKSLPSRD